jgi:hypothetical protein
MPATWQHGETPFPDTFGTSQACYSSYPACPHLDTLFPLVYIAYSYNFYSSFYSKFLPECYTRTCVVPG